VTGRRNIIIAVGAIVIFAAIVGFFITLDVSPQIAYARLFIDLGLAIGLVAVIMAFYKERPLPIESIVQALKSLKAGKFKTRLTVNEKNPLAEIATAINEMAKSLEMENNRQEEIKRNLREELLPSLKNKEIVGNIDHSFHPELGPVVSLPQDNNGPEEKTNNDMSSLSKEQKYKNTLIESKPPVGDSMAVTKVNAPVAEQDLGELYQQFIDAQRAIDIDQIEYTAFLKTIEKTRAELMNSFQCRTIIFDIVREKSQVALQPKIIR